MMRVVRMMMVVAFRLVDGAVAGVGIVRRDDVEQLDVVLAVVLVTKVLEKT